MGLGRFVAHPENFIIVNPVMTTEAGQIWRNQVPAQNPRVSPAAGVHPVFLSPAEIPLIVAAIALLTSGVSSPARLRRSMST